RLAEFAQNIPAAHDLGQEWARNAADAITVGLTGRTH
ncbi:MAG: hypothetical protein QOE51_2699, partial [Actinoplanes sp.]|nr:hypothetical protein [Actinoplanes sp.]